MCVVCGNGTDSNGTEEQKQEPGTGTGIGAGVQNMEMSSPQFKTPSPLRLKNRKAIEQIISPSPGLMGQKLKKKDSLCEESTSAKLIY